MWQKKFDFVSKILSCTNSWCNQLDTNVLCCMKNSLSDELFYQENVSHCILIFECFLVSANIVNQAALLRVLYQLPLNILQRRKPNFAWSWTSRASVEQILSWCILLLKAHTTMHWFKVLSIKLKYHSNIS